MTGTNERAAAASRAASAIQEIMHHACTTGEEGGCLTYGVLKATIQLEIDKLPPVLGLHLHSVMRERKNCPDGKENTLTKEVWCKRYENFCKHTTDCKHR